MVVRSSDEQWMRPHIVVTSPRVENFFYTHFNQTTDAFAIKLEGYCIGGIPGMPCRLPLMYLRPG